MCHYCSANIHVIRPWPYMRIPAQPVNICGNIEDLSCHVQRAQSISGQCSKQAISIPGKNKNCCLANKLNLIMIRSEYSRMVYGRQSQVYVDPTHSDYSSRINSPLLKSSTAQLYFICPAMTRKPL
jgi:hypothetical protein